MVGCAKFGDEDEMETLRLCIPTWPDFRSYFWMQIRSITSCLAKRLDRTVSAPKGDLWSVLRIFLHCIEGETGFASYCTGGGTRYLFEGATVKGESGVAKYLVNLFKDCGVSL